MSKRINLSVYEHQIICYQSASAGVLVTCWTGKREVRSSNPQREENFPGKQMCYFLARWSQLLGVNMIHNKYNIMIVYS